jgi:hypothetical protein
MYEMHGVKPGPLTTGSKEPWSAPDASPFSVKQLPLPLFNDIPVRRVDEITVHCFFRCGHVVRSVDPHAAHQLMERHYDERHTQQINRIVGQF